jgi:CTP:molybdopterin cytidylyltransferase MocA
VGAREALARHAARVEAIETTDAGILMDIDALDDMTGAGDEE